MIYITIELILVNHSLRGYSYHCYLQILCVNGVRTRAFAESQDKEGFNHFAEQDGISILKTLKKLRYEAELVKLQSEFVNLQKWVAQNGMRVAVIFEGRDAAVKVDQSKDSKSI